MSEAFPFKPGYEPIEGQSYMYAYPENPALILREFVVDCFDLVQNECDLPGYMKLSQELFNELSDEYNIPVASFRPTLMNKQYQFAFVVDRIPGQVFEQQQFGMMTEEQKAAGREVLENVYRYAHDKIESGEAYLTDHITNLEQYVFDERQGAFVFIDLEPFIQAPRGKEIDRVSVELGLVSNLLDGATHLSSNPSETARWRQRGWDLLGLICDKNGYTLLDQDKESILDGAMAGDDTNLDILDGIFARTKAYDENRAFLQGCAERYQATRN